RLGADQIATESAIPPRYRLDAFRAHRGSRLPEGGVTPAAVVWPRSTEDVSVVVHFAADAGLSIVPWGGGTGLMGGARPTTDSIVADGTILRTRPAVRSTTGLDLRRLFIGTEGTLGIVTAATLRVFPIPEREEIHAFSIRDFPTGLACLVRMYDDGLAPAVMD